MADLELIDTSAIFDNYFQNKYHFVTFEEFKNIFQQFQTASSSLFRVKNSASVERENQRRKEPIPVWMKYANICFCCVHYGSAKYRGNGIRTFQRYLPQHCPAFVQLIYKSPHKALVLTNKSLVHNHNLSPENFRNYAANRRLTKDEEYMVRDIIKLGVGNAFLKEFLFNKFHKQLTLIDIKNLKTRIEQEEKKSNAIESPPRTNKFQEPIIRNCTELIVPYQSNKSAMLLRTANINIFRQIKRNLGESYISDTTELSKQIEEVEGRSIVSSSSELNQDSTTVNDQTNLLTMVWTTPSEEVTNERIDEIQIKGEPMTIECPASQNELFPADCSQEHYLEFRDIGINTDRDPLLAEVCRLQEENQNLKQSLKEIQDLSKVISNLCGTQTSSN